MASSFVTPSQNVEGEESRIGVVLWLRLNKVEKEVPFELFREKTVNYISRNMKYGNKVVGIVKK